MKLSLFFAIASFILLSACNDEEDELALITEYSELSQMLAHIDQERSEYMEQLPRELAATFGSRYHCLNEQNMNPDAIHALALEPFLGRHPWFISQWTSMKGDLISEYEKFQSPNECARMYVANAQRRTMDEILDYRLALEAAASVAASRRLDVTRALAD